MPRVSANALAIVAIDGRPNRLAPPSGLSKAERAAFINTVTSVKPGHFNATDLPLLCRHAEVVAMSDHAAKKLRVDISKGRPSHWLGTQERLLKMLVVLNRQLRIGVMSRAPNNPSRPGSKSNGIVANIYERMALDEAEPQ